MFRSAAFLLSALAQSRKTFKMVGMSKRRIIVVLFLGLVAIIATLSRWPHEAEPHYHNIPLSEWLALNQAYQFHKLARSGRLILPQFKKYEDVPGVEKFGPEAKEAVRQIGTNAISVMVEWMKLHPSRWKPRVAGIVNQLPRVIRPERLPGWLSPVKDYERAALADDGFRILGATASPAIPDLVRIACDTNAIGWVSAVDVLVALKKSAMPALANQLNIFNVLSRYQPREIQKRFVQVLGVLGVDAIEAIPTVISYFKQPDEELAEMAATTLARIRQRPDLTVPALIACLDDSRYRVRLAAVKALGDIGSDALPAAFTLRSLLAGPEIELSVEAGRALLEIVPAPPSDPLVIEFTPSAAGFGEPQ
jgi:HEAT repeats